MGVRAAHGLLLVLQLQGTLFWVCSHVFSCATFLYHLFFSALSFLPLPCPVLQARGQDDEPTKEKKRAHEPRSIFKTGAVATAPRRDGSNNEWCNAWRTFKSRAFPGAFEAQRKWGFDRWDAFKTRACCSAPTAGAQAGGLALEMWYRLRGQTLHEVAQNDISDHEWKGHQKRTQCL